jgi:hypothetical protein
MIERMSLKGLLEMFEGIVRFRAKKKTVCSGDILRRCILMAYD